MKANKKVVDINRQRVVNFETGDVLGLLGDGDRIKIVRKKQIEHTRDYEKLKYKKFNLNNIAELKLLKKELTIAECGFLGFLADHISYQDNFVQHDNKKDIKVEELPELTGLSRKTVYAMLKKLEDMYVICRIKQKNETRIIFNPMLCVCGRYFNKTLKKIFKEYQIRSKNMIKWGDLQ